MIDIINALIKSFADIFLSVLNLLPDSPFTISFDFGNFWGYVNYFIPFSTLYGIMTTYVSAVILYYAVRWLLRLVKFIQ